MAAGPDVCKCGCAEERHMDFEHGRVCKNWKVCGCRGWEPKSQTPLRDCLDRLGFKP